MKTLESAIHNSEKTSNLDEFDMYLKKQCLKTTFNGIEFDTFNWYKNILGFNK